ncbi:LodA/GoxA family CTQ-dependent oxidase [Hyalangium gracile]|uniref:LodA/GoxA family CTQ-dependent oxidase n=1 Tax=Hyalangium gracile TaxID=394092 RepID=UPI001CCF2765|nr:LodA/GoxA family CTQ-dependent oxidase [Hyalangium gracile]
MSTIYKIHPAIGVARVGDSEDFYLGPEAAGALPTERDGSPVTRFRDNANGLRRQAARFRIYAYDTPGAPGREIVPGQGGVKDIQWTVYLANKKAAWYEFQQQEGADGTYTQDHALRNPRTLGADRQKLIIDPGPQTITCLGSDHTPTQAEFSKGKGPAGFTQNFPPTGLLPENNDITTLGRIFTDASGALYTLGGYGRSGVETRYDITSLLLTTLNPNDADDDQALLPKAIVHQLKKIADLPFATQAAFEDAIRQVLGADYDAYIQKIEYYAYPQPRLDDYANNSFWWDDVSDGPVTATLIMEEGPPVEVHSPSWVLVAPPAYAPQILNMITLYDTMYDVFVRKGKLNPALYSGGAVQPELPAELPGRDPAHPEPAGRLSVGRQHQRPGGAGALQVHQRAGQALQLLRLCPSARGRQ